MYDPRLVRLGLGPAKIDAGGESEFDIAFMYKYRLSMIECKSGPQEHDYILHKVEAMVRQFHALRVRSCLVITSTNVLDSAGKLRPGIENWAAVYRCCVVVRDQIRRLTRDADRPELLRQVLFDAQENT